MKQTAQNTFQDGLNYDLHPIVTPNSVLTDNINGTLITYNGNEFCLQNDRGNNKVGILSSSYIPIGVKEHNGILYIVSCIPQLVNNNTVYTTEIGTYPGLDWDVEEETPTAFSSPYVYAPLQNYYGTVTTRGYFLEMPNFSTNGPINGKSIQEINSDLKTILINNNAHSVPSDVTHGVWVEFTGNPSTAALNLGLALNEIKTYCTNSLNLIERGGYYGRKSLMHFTKVCTKPTASLYKTEYNKTNFRTTDFGFNPNNPVSIEVQDSYDGSVNLIITDGVNNTRIINSGFSVLPNNKYKIIKRNQDDRVLTNTYDESTVNIETKLIQSVVSFAKFSLNGLNTGGQLKGGNYTFYAKLGDADGNVSDICAESGVISVFKGTVSKPSTISGTLADELTDKQINLTLNNINVGFSKVYLYATREYSDVQGYRITEAFKFEKPFDIITDELFGQLCEINITGFENTTSISLEDLNISYLTIENCRTFAQQQDMLFLGNISKNKQSYEKLDTFAKLIKTRLCRYSSDEIVATEPNNPELDDIGCVDGKYENDGEYYNPQNIYSKVGYFPGEYYRFGVVFILGDGSLSSVYNMYGGKFDSFTNSNITTNFITNESNSVEKWNEYGVFRLPMENSNTMIIKEQSVIPWHFNFNFSEVNDAIKNDSEYKNIIKGYFIVRQKRIP